MGGAGTWTGAETSHEGRPQTQGWGPCFPEWRPLSGSWTAQPPRPGCVESCRAGMGAAVLAGGVTLVGRHPSPRSSWGLDSTGSGPQWSRVRKVGAGARTAHRELQVSQALGGPSLRCRLWGGPTPTYSRTQTSQFRGISGPRPSTLRAEGCPTWGGYQHSWVGSQHLPGLPGEARGGRSWPRPQGGPLSHQSRDTGGQNLP